MPFKFPPLSPWIPVLLWMSVIFAISSISTLPSAQKIWWDFFIKKSAHIGEYAILFFLLARALQDKDRLRYPLCFLITIIYAISDEFHQSFTPGRSARLADVGFDSLGGSIAYLKLKNFI